MKDERYFSLGCREAFMKYVLEYFPRYLQSVERQNIIGSIFVYTIHQFVRLFAS
jgi:hypothetical protein